MKPLPGPDGFISPGALMGIILSAMSLLGKKFGVQRSRTEGSQ